MALRRKKCESRAGFLREVRAGCGRPRWLVDAPADRPVKSRFLEPARATPKSMSKITYKDSGVDLATYEESMSRLPRLMRRTHCPRVLPNDGGFAGLFKLDFT